MKPSISTSVVIPWKDRSELRRSLQSNEKFLTPNRCEVIVVNCGGDTQALGESLSGLSSNIRFVSARREMFNKSFAQNVGAAVALGEILLMLDADVILDVDLVDIVAGGMGPNEFLTVASVRESDFKDVSSNDGNLELAYHTEITVPGGRMVKLETNRVIPHTGVRSGPGLLGVRRKHYFAVGGANSSLLGWGWEDLDLICRLQFEIGLARLQAGSVMHLSHPDNDRLLHGRSRAESERQNFLDCIANYSSGLFQGTIIEDIKAWNELAGDLQPPSIH